MQYTIDIDPIILQKAQLYAQEKGIDFNKYVEKQLTPSRAQGTKKTLVALLGVIVGILALFVFCSLSIAFLRRNSFCRRGCSMNDVLNDEDIVYVKEFEKRFYYWRS